MRFIKCTVLFFIWIGFYPTLIGQIKNIGIPEIKNYTKSEYKGGTQNWDIAQDKKGNMYFANNKGLLQFDGSSWTIHKLPNLSGLRSLKIDGSGKIFVGGYNEFGYFKSNTRGKLEYTSLSKLIHPNSSEIDIDLIWKIHFNTDEVLFQSFEGIYIYKNKKLRFLKAPKKFQFSFQVKNNLYFQDVLKGIQIYKNGSLFPIEGTTFFNTTEIWGMFPLENDQILIATLDKGLFKYDNGKLTPWETESNTFIKKNSSLGGVLIDNKHLALNSVSDGLILSDINGKIIQQINRTRGLQNNTILTSFIDNDNTIWLGLDNGISIINANSPFTYFGFSYNLSTVYASVVHKGNLYVATNQGLYYHPWDGSIIDNKFILVEGTIGQTWNIQLIDDRLICAHNNGALLIKDGKSVKIVDANGYFYFKKIPNIPNYILGSKYDGFGLFEKTATGLKFRNSILGFDKSATTFEIDEDFIWLKKDANLYQLQLSKDFKKFDYIKKYDRLTPSIKGIGSIQNINKEVSFQVNNQFFNYSEKQNIFFEDKKTNELFKNIPNITSSNEDVFGNIWYVFNETMGVLMVDKKGNYENIQAPFSNLTNNLVSNYFSINSITPNSSFIGLSNGLAHFDSKFLNNLKAKPKAFINFYSIHKDSINTENIQNSIQDDPIENKSNHVKFTFSSPTYVNLEKLEFSYQLEGFDELWSTWSKTISKEYTNLWEGEYKMKVKARNSYGVQSDVVSVGFTILPPWYRHYITYLGYLSLLLVLLYFIRKRIKNKIYKDKIFEKMESRKIYLEKESQINQDKYELEKKIDTLKSNALQIKILAKDKELVNNSLQVVKKNKILNGIIYKLKDINLDTLDESTKIQFTKLNKSIIKEVNADKSWNELEKHIKNVHFDFLKRLKEKYPTISPRELDLSTYLLLNMSTKEIAVLMNISIGGVELARFRLRKKLGLSKKENLIGFLMFI